MAAGDGIDRPAFRSAGCGRNGARRIIRSLFPPVALFEDIADPEDWPLLIAAEQKTNPRLMETLGALDLVPPSHGFRPRRQLPHGAVHPCQHRPPDPVLRRQLRRALRGPPVRDGAVRDHAPPRPVHGPKPGTAGLDVAVPRARHRRRRDAARPARRRSSLAPALDPDGYATSQALGAALRAAGSDGVVYPSARDAGGACTGLFYPDLARNPVQGRHLDYHWDGTRVDLYRDAGSGEVFRVEWPG